MSDVTRSLAPVRLGLAVLSVAVVAPVALGGGNQRIIASHGVRMHVPSGWQRVQATPSSVTDPRTVLVVGTAGVRPDLTVTCDVSAYQVPVRAAVVVVEAWRTATSGGGHLKPGRAPLRQLRTVKRPSFECYAGRGAAAQVVLGRRAYQINVLVGDKASKQRVADALAVARSFDLVP
jgi:hypothetical protein